MFNHTHTYEECVLILKQYLLSKHGFIHIGDPAGEMLFEKRWGTELGNWEVVKGISTSYTLILPFSEEVFIKNILRLLYICRQREYGPQLTTFLRQIQPVRSLQSGHNILPLLPHEHH